MRARTAWEVTIFWGIIAKTTWMSNNSVRSLKKSKPAANRPVFVVMTLKSNLKKMWRFISMYRATMRLVKMENGVPSPFISVKAIVINYVLFTLHDPSRNWYVGVNPGWINMQRTLRLLGCEMKRLNAYGYKYIRPPSLVVLSDYAILMLLDAVWKHACLLSCSLIIFLSKISRAWSRYLKNIRLVRDHMT